MSDDKISQVSNEDIEDIRKAIKRTEQSQPHTKDEERWEVEVKSTNG